MKPFVILTDTTCDLGETFQKEYDIHVIPGHLGLPDKTEIPSFLSWDRMSRDAFYTDLKRNPSGYSTAPPSAEELSRVFSAYAAQGNDILYLSISGGMSGTYRFALSAREAVLLQYPDTNICCVDTLRFGPGLGLMTVYAAMQRREGKTLEETAAWLEENKNRFHQAGWLDDLSFVAKKGRITHPKAFFGTLAGIKPIGEFDYTGLTTVLGKVKGAKAAYALLCAYIEKTIEQPEEQIIFIAQTNRLPQAQEYQALIQERFHPKAIYINDVFPSCGINIGPGLMAAYYVGKPISRDLSEERGIIDAILNGGTT